MTTAMERVNGTRAESDIDLEAAARAEAIRLEAQAKAEAERIRAEGDAEAARIKAHEDAEKQRLANERADLRLRRERAEQEAKIAEANRKKEESERAARAAREQEQQQAAAERHSAEKREAAAKSWRKAALGFAIVCAVVALPVQMAAFYNEDALWLLAAPLVLEGGAWVILRGAAAAVEDHRPHWHYRLIAWALAFIAAGINLAHGMHAFDAATAIGTAFASLAGPSVWDLHEHGRIATRDGKLTRRQRKAPEHAAKKAAAKKAAEELRNAERQAYLEKAAREAAEKLAQERAEQYPEVWEHALKLAAALGETTVTEAVWKKAHNNVLGADPGEDADTIRLRNAAQRRVVAARSEAPGERPVKVTNAQRDSQMPRRGRGNPGGPPVRGVRRPGDTPKYVGAARRQAAITAKKSTQKEA
jgi:hypothetical protein